MINVEVDKVSLQKVEKKLGKLQSKAPEVLKKALNQTAKQARKDLAKKAQATYTVKVGGFNKDMKIVSATNGRLEAVIKSQGKPIELKKFRISKASGTIRAQVLKSGGLKPLEKGGIKAFVNNVANSGQTRKKDTAKGAKGTSVTHAAVAQRVGKERLPIKTFYGNSIPKMLGSEKRVYGIVKPDIKKNLKKNVNEQIRRLVGQS